MGLAEPKMKGKKLAMAWKAQRFREKMLDTSIAHTPSLGVGLKLMSKMGWKDGQGLGANEQGIVEPIKLKQTINNKGLGYSCATGVEQVHYSGHFERFESVLASLGGKNQTAAEEQNETTEDEMSNTKKNTKKAKQTDSSDRESSCSEEEDNCQSKKESLPSQESGPLKKYAKQSLEGLSRRVRGRVHYQKFTRGKDVSRYSEDDLACILGAKAHTLYTSNNKQDQESSDGKFVHGSTDSKSYFAGLSTPSSSRSTSDTDEPKTFTPSFPLSNVSDEEGDDSRPTFGGLGLGAANRARDNDSSNEDTERPAFGGAGNGNNDDDAVQKCFSQRFAAGFMNSFVKAEEGLGGTIKFGLEDSKKSELTSEEPVAVDYLSAFVKADEGIPGTLSTELKEKNCQEDSNNSDKNIDSELIDTEQINKKKRKKNKKNGSSEFDPKSVSKKKKKKLRKDINFPEESFVLPLEEECEAEADGEHEPAKRKSKKKKGMENSSEYLLNAENEDVESKSEKKKKKKKRKREDDVSSNDCNAVFDEVVQQDTPTDDDVPLPKRKKSKKSKNTCLEAEENVVINSRKETAEECQTNTNQEKKKKKKKEKNSS